MGGPGSGNWYRWDKKTTVEECLTLDVSRLVQEDVIAPGLSRRGSWGWSRWGEITSSIGYRTSTDDHDGRFTLDYQVSGESISLAVPLTVTFPHFGGVRWWFICGVSCNGVYCGRRVGKLYLPPGGKLFACRHCYDLTYKSCQESDKRLSALRRLSPDALAVTLDAMLDGDNSTDLLLALKMLV